jgi:hypothetical protein
MPPLPQPACLCALSLPDWRFRHRWNLDDPLLGLLPIYFSLSTSLRLRLRLRLRLHLCVSIFRLVGGVIYATIGYHDITHDYSICTHIVYTFSNETDRKAGAMKINPSIWAGIPFLGKIWLGLDLCLVFRVRLRYEGFCLTDIFVAPRRQGFWATRTTLQYSTSNDAYMQSNDKSKHHSYKRISYHASGRAYIRKIAFLRPYYYT